MEIHESGVSARSVRHFFTPSSQAERLFFYPTRIGHYYCDRQYRFSYRSDIGQEPSHRFHYMLFLIHRGRMELTIDGQHDTAGADDVVLFDCRRAHEYSALTDDFEFYWLVFDGAMSETLYGELLRHHGGRHAFPAGDATQVQRLFARLLTYAELPGRRPEHVMSELIYAMLCRSFARTGVGEGDMPEAVEQALRVMDEGFDRPLSVEQVAEAAGLSTSHLTKLFRRATGFSPHEYVTLRRIGRAKELLIATDLTVARIADEVGYAGEENFIRSFKKKVGVSPTAFRRYPV